MHSGQELKHHVTRCMIERLALRRASSDSLVHSPLLCCSSAQLVFNLRTSRNHALTCVSLRYSLVLVVFVVYIHVVDTTVAPSKS